MLNNNTKSGYFVNKRMNFIKKAHPSPKSLLWLALFFFLLQFHPQRITALNMLEYSWPETGNEPSKKPLAIVGDLQKTSLAEMVLGRESNDEERVLLINEIEKQDPAMTVLLGDMVFDGSDSEQWDEFDRLLRPLRRHKIPVYPVLGNHEYWGYNSVAEHNFCKRFSQFTKKSWYVQKYDSLALVFLNSNEADMTPSDWMDQQAWYNQKLADFDNDPSVKGVLIFLHHPPYTNSMVTGDEVNVQLAFVPGYLKSRKGLALISGHAHTYERFIKDGKAFIVSGGGGGPRVGLNDGIDFHKDLYKGGSPRPFHFLLVSRDETGVKLTVRGLLKGSSIFFTMEEFYLNRETKIEFAKAQRF